MRLSVTIKHFIKKIALFKRNEDGLVLVDVALMLLLGSLLLGGFVATLRPVDREVQTEITREKMQKVIYAMSIYVQKYNRMPCPADPAGSGPEPFGAEHGSGNSGTNEGSCSGSSEIIGIVPFKTLGLTENDVLDEWGHYLTYRTSNILGQTDPNATPAPKVHAYCRIKDEWVVTGGGGGDKNINPRKAIFCCPQPESGFDVVDRNDSTYLPESNTNCSGSCGGQYQPINSPEPIPSLNDDDELPDALAMVLVSHGRNGFGSFLRDGTQMDIGNAGSYSAAEQENADGDGLFTWIAPSRESPSNYFDDIVLWRTQALLYTELGSRYSNCTDLTPGVDSTSGGGGGGGGSGP